MSSDNGKKWEFVHTPGTIVAPVVSNDGLLVKLLNNNKPNSSNQKPKNKDKKSSNQGSQAKQKKFNNKPNQRYNPSNKKPKHQNKKPSNQNGDDAGKWVDRAIDVAKILIALKVLKP